MWGVITRSCQPVGEETARPLVSLKVTPRGSSETQMDLLQWCKSPLCSFKQKESAACSVHVRYVRAKFATFVSAWIQSCCVSCVSAPTTRTRSVWRYSSTVNTALPETPGSQSTAFDVALINNLHICFIKKLQI